jgi:hypothetical protein
MRRLTQVAWLVCALSISGLVIPPLAPTLA